MSKYFNKDGSPKLEMREYFDDEDYGEYLKPEIEEELSNTINDYPSDSFAVGLYWITVAANQTHGNYSEGAIADRALYYEFYVKSNKRSK